MKKILIVTFVLMSFVFINQAQAQTSGSYILGASSRFMSAPFSGFGIDMTPDSCLGYLSVKADVSKMVYALTSQISQTFRSYNAAKCNTQTTLNATCSAYADTINNLALTYATYRIDWSRQARDKAYICDANNNRIPNKYKNTYYNIDFPAIAYASVRDAYAGKKYADYTTFINTINTNITTKLNTAITAGKFTDVVPASAINTTYVAPAPATTTASGVRAPRQRVVPPQKQYTLRELSQITFRTISAVTPPAQRLSINPPTNLSGPNMFLVFGLTSNTDSNNKTIAAIPFNSLGEYVGLYNSNPTRFGEIYSVANKELITKGASILQYVNKRLQQSMPERGMDLSDGIAKSADSSNIIPAQTQKAFVGGAVGEIWNAVASFFKNLFGVKEAGAQSGGGDSGSGDGNGSGVAAGPCPAAPNPIPPPVLTWHKKIDTKMYPFVTPPQKYDTARLLFHNLIVPDPARKEVLYFTQTILSDPMPKLSKEEYDYFVNFYLSIENDSDIYDILQKYALDPEGLKKWLDKKRDTGKKTDTSTSTAVAKLSPPDNPYSCLRVFDVYRYSGINHGSFGKANITVVALSEKNQSAKTILTLEIWSDYLRFLGFGDLTAKSLSNRLIEEHNRRNNIK